MKQNRGEKKHLKQKRKIQRRHPHGDGSGLRIFSVSFVVTLMLACGAGTVTLALGRMENTLQSKPFTVFSLEKKAIAAQAGVGAPLKENAGDAYTLTVWNQTVEIPSLEAYRQEGDNLLKWFPAELRAFMLTADKLTDAFGLLAETIL